MRIRRKEINSPSSENNKFYCQHGMTDQQLYGLHSVTEVYSLKPDTRAGSLDQQPGCPGTLGEMQNPDLLYNKILKVSGCHWHLSSSTLEHLRLCGFHFPGWHSSSMGKCLGFLSKCCHFSVMMHLDLLLRHRPNPSTTILSDLSLAFFYPRLWTGSYVPCQNYIKGFWFSFNPKNSLCRGEDGKNLKTE